MSTFTPWSVQPIPLANAWVVYRIEDLHGANGKHVGSKRHHAFSGKLFPTQRQADQMANALNQPITN